MRQRGRETEGVRFVEEGRGGADTDRQKDRENIGDSQKGGRSDKVRCRQ